MVALTFIMVPVVIALLIALWVGQATGVVADLIAWGRNVIVGHGVAPMGSVRCSGQQAIGPATPSACETPRGIVPAWAQPTTMDAAALHILRDPAGMVARHAAVWAATAAFDLVWQQMRT